MTRIASALLAEFLSVLRRCAPVGETTRPPPLVAVRATGAGLTLVGTNGGVGLTARVEGRFEPAALACTADALQTVVAGASEWVGFEVSGSGSLLATRDLAGPTAGCQLTVIDPARVPDVPPPSHWQSIDPAFIQAMRDASRLAGRTSHYRHAYHRVLIDTPLGKVMATDGSSLHVHGGFALVGAAIAVPAVAAWAAKVWAAADEVAVGFTEVAVAVRRGVWTLHLPIDRSARMPKYGEVLVRLRAPVARFTLSNADADAWSGRLGAWVKSEGRDEPVVLTFADPPTLSRAGGTDSDRVFAAASSFAGLRSVRATTDPAPLRRALSLGFRTVTAVGAGHPLVALEGPRRFVWATLDEPVPLKVKGEVGR
jgi:hypothetical protein